MEVKTCPICTGSGIVDEGFYRRTSDTWTSCGGTEKCRACNGKGYVIIPEINRDVERWVYLSSIPDLKKLKVDEGKLALMKFTDSFKLKMIPGDVKLLKEIYESLKQK